VKTKQLCGALVSLGIVCASGVAGAAPRNHDGFQFRGALGFGFLSGNFKADVPVGLPGLGVGNIGGTISGPAGSFELYFGGTPAQGLTLGGYLSATVAAGPTYKADNGVSGTANGDVSLNLFTGGPYIDFYPDPTTGFHLLGTLGYAELTASNDNTTSEASTGVGVGAGIGYDWWVGDEWSLGVLGRFTYAAVSHEAAGSKETDSVIAPALLFSVCFQ
jgi:hypothetical protein